MATREGLTRAFLWLAVLVGGPLLGAKLFDLLVLAGAWSAHPPASLAMMPYGTAWPVDTGVFFIPFSALMLVAGFGALVAGWRTPWRYRWAAVPAVDRHPHPADPDRRRVLADERGALLSRCRIPKGHDYRQPVDRDGAAVGGAGLGSSCRSDSRLRCSLKSAHHALGQVNSLPKTQPPCGLRSRLRWSGLLLSLSGLWPTSDDFWAIAEGRLSVSCAPAGRLPAVNEEPVRVRSRYPLRAPMRPLRQRRDSARCSRSWRVRAKSERPAGCRTPCR